MSRSALPKVAIVGPVPPFRSGIAQHTSALAQALARRCQVKILSFKRQYPAWLFPGASDRDPEAAPLEWPETHYLVDSLNPFTWRQALLAIDAFRPDLVLIPWWTVFWAPTVWYLARGCRRRGLPVRLLCHNVLDHESVGWKAWLTRLTLRQAPSFLVHSKAEGDRLATLVPGARITSHPHPLYDSYPQPTHELPRRADLELLFFGLVRPYKGLDVLIEAMGLTAPASIHLSVVGEFWQGRAEIEARIGELGLQDRIELVPRYVSDQEAADYFARADVVVLPYTSVTTSGVIALAYHYGKPVIASRIGGLPDLVRHGETGLLVPPKSAPALAEAIGAFTAERAAQMEGAIRDLTRSMTWDHLAACLLEPMDAGADQLRKRPATPLSSKRAANTA